MICLCVCAYMCACVHARILVCLYMHVYVHTHTCTCACVLTHVQLRREITGSNGTRYDRMMHSFNGLDRTCFATASR